MKVSPLLAGALLATAGSKNQVEAKAPLNQLATPFSRGAATGSLCTGIKSLASDLLRSCRGGECQSTNQDSQHTEAANDPPAEDLSRSAITSRSNGPAAIALRALKHFPLSMGANAAATAFVDKMMGASKQTTLQNIKELPLPISCLLMTQEMLANAPISPRAKQLLSYGAFCAGRFAQGKDPAKTVVAVAGFAAGASVAKSVGRRIVGPMLAQSKADARPDKSVRHKEDLVLVKSVGKPPAESTRSAAVSASAVSASAVSGFLSPDSARSGDNAKPGTYDDFIRQRYGLKDGEKFWEGPDGSVFVPVKPGDLI